MSSGGWNTVLVLGGLQSGKVRYAESLLPGAGEIRRITRADAADLAALAALLAEAKPDQTLYVEQLDGWLTTAGSAPDQVSALAAAVRGCAARLVLVSAEVGWAVPSAANRRSCEAVGTGNEAVAEATDALVLVVAGQPIWLKGASAEAGRPGAGTPVTAALPAPAPLGAGPAAGQAGVVSAGTDQTSTDQTSTDQTSTQQTDADLTDADLTDADLTDADLKDLPGPDEAARAAAQQHLATLGGTDLGTLAAAVTFAAATQSRPGPLPWHHIRVLVLHGDHGGASAAGAAGSAGAAEQIRTGAAALTRLAGAAGAAVQIVAADSAAAIEDGPATTAEAVDQALRHGWRQAQRAADEGVDLIVLGSIGAGAQTAAAAVTALITGTEPASLLGRVRSAEGLFDDAAWMLRCAAVRDAAHRARAVSRRAARTVLAEVGGADLAIATGLLLGAAARRTPVLLDGPVGAAACLLSRDLAGQARHWCLLADHGGDPTVARVAEVLKMTPLMELKLSLGEGAAALAVLPLLRSALLLAATMPPAGYATAAAAPSQSGQD